MRSYALTWLLATSAFALPSSGLVARSDEASSNEQQSSKWIPGDTSGTDALAAQALQNLGTYHPRASNASSSCTLANAARRREWDSFSVDEKLEYIRAVRCLQTKPDISGGLVPGARNRYDDFVAAHVNQTGRIHQTGNFLTWHRYYVWTYEKALREECDYKGYQPYVNWGRYVNGVVGSPLFDGSNTSISNDGVYKKHATLHFPSTGNHSVIDLPPENGGGCITAGPFKDYKVHLGPVGPIGGETSKPNPRSDGLGYNPRCLERDLSILAASGTSDANSTKLIKNNADIASFQDEMQGPFNKGIPEYGVHTAGHFMVSGDPGGDVFISPGDPWFWFHHAQIDRVYWIWQNLGLPVRDRFETISGTLTLNNQPPSRNATVEDIIELGVNDNFEGITIKDALDTMAGPFCYLYE